MWNTFYSFMEVEPDLPDPTQLFQELYSQLNLPSEETSNELMLMICLSLFHLDTEHLERLLAFIYFKIEENEENELVLCWLIGVVEDLVKSDFPSMTPSLMRDLQHAFWPLVQHHSYKVKEAMANFIHTLERGGHLYAHSALVFIRFITDESVKPQYDPITSEMMEVKDEGRKLTKLCMKILTGCVLNPCMAKIMCPILVDYIAPEYFGSISIILTSVLYLAEKFQSEGKDILDDNCSNEVLDTTIFMPNVKTPRAQKLFLRLMTLSYSSQGNSEIHENALRIISLLRNEISKDLGKEWMLEIDNLLHYLEAHEKTCAPTFWKKKILQFMEYTLQCMRTTKWIFQFWENIIDDLRGGRASPRAKNFLFQSLGIAWKLVEGKINEQHLWICLESVNDKEKEECEGFALGMGFWATGHLEDALDGLEKMATLVENLHYGTILYYIKLPTCKKLTQLLLLTFQKILLLVPREQLLPILETTIIEKIVNLYSTSCPDREIGREFVQAFLVAGDIMTKEKGFIFKTPLREAVTNHLLQILDEESKECLDSSICSDILTSLSYLGELQPPMKENEVDHILSMCLKSVLSFKEKSPLRTPTQSLSQKKTEALAKFLNTLLENQPKPEIILKIFKHLSQWLASEEPLLRIEIMKLSQLLFSFYYTSEDVQLLSCLGFFVGTLYPRCFDPLECISKWAFKTMTILLEGTLLPGSEHSNLKTDGQETDTSSLKPIDIAMLIFIHLPFGELLTFLNIISDGIMDRATSTQSVVRGLRMMIQLYGAKVKDEIPSLLPILVKMLHSLKDEVARRELTATIQHLTRLAPKSVVHFLLSNPIPYDKDIRELWRSFGHDPSLANLVLPLLLHCEEDQKKESKSLLKSQQTIPRCPEEIQALWEVTAALQFKETLEGLEDKFFITFFLSLPHLSMVQASQCNTTGPNELVSHSYLEAGFKNFLELQGFHRAVLQMESLQVWKLLKNVQFLHIGVINLCRSLVHIPKIFNHNVLQNLLPFLKSVQHEYRMICTALFSELLGSQELGVLQKNSMNAALKMVIESTKDVNPLISFLAVRALGNALVWLPKKIYKQKKIIFKVLIEALYQAYDPKVIEETLTVLGKCVPFLKSLKSRTVLPLILHVRALLRDEITNIRLAAVTLYGLLLSFVKKKPVFVHQVEKSLGSLLILLKDDDPRIAKESRIVLRNCSSFLQAVPLREFLSNLQPKGEINFPQFYSKAFGLLVESSSETKDKTLISKVASAAEIFGFMEQEDMIVLSPESPKELLYLL